MIFETAHSLPADVAGIMNLPAEPLPHPAAWVQPQFRHVVASTAAEADEAKTFNADLDRQAGELGGRQGKLRQPHRQRLAEAKLAAIPPPLLLALKVTQAIPGDKRTDAQKALIDTLTALTPEERRTDESLEREKAALRARRRDVEKIQADWDVGPAPNTFLLKRGDHETPGAAVEPGLPAVLAGFAPPATGRGGRRWRRR